MAQDEKDLKKYNTSKTVQNKNNGKKSATESAKQNPPKAEVKKNIKDAENVLTKDAETKGKATDSPKSSKDGSVKGLTSYQEQALQDVTKSKGNKKMLIIILILVGIAVVAGVGIALFLMLKPKEEIPKNVVCKVEVISYRIEKEIDPEKRYVLGDGDIFNFDEGSESLISYTKDLEASISEVRDVALEYLVNNVTTTKYVYTLNFSDMIIENCNVVVKINNGETYSINDNKKIITISQAGDIVFEVRISVKDTTIPDLIDNTRCEGGIDLSLSVE